MIDVSKIKVGDEVTVRGVVTHKVDMPNPKFGLCFSKPQDKSWCNVEAYAIVTHTPAQREFKPGDRVMWIENDQHRWRVIAIDGGSAWLKWDGYAGSSDTEPHSPHFDTRATHPIQQLCHSDKASER